MTTNDLVDTLRRLDPGPTYKATKWERFKLAVRYVMGEDCLYGDKCGDTPVCINNQTIIDIRRTPAGRGGDLQILKRDRSEVRFSDEGEKINLQFAIFDEIIDENPNIKVTYSSEGAFERNHRVVQAARLMAPPKLIEIS